MDTVCWDLLDHRDKALILQGIARGKAVAPPRIVDLEWSRREWLPDGTGVGRPGSPPDEMDLYTLEMLFEEMEDAGVKGLCLGGEGDPLAHRSIGSLFRRLERAPFRLCSLSTGGFVLDGRTMEGLAAVLRGRLEVRLEAADEDAGEERLGLSRLRFRRAAGFIRGLRSLRPSPPFRIVARLVLRPEDLGSIRRLLDAVAAMGADAVAFAASRRPGDPGAALERRPVFLREVQAAYEGDTEGRIASLEAPHPLLAVELDALRAAHPDRYPEASLSGAGGVRFRTACVRPWLGPAIAPNGAVSACRRSLPDAAVSAGNVHGRPLERIWRDRPLRSLRRAAHRPRWDGRTCPSCRAHESPCHPYVKDRGFCQELDSLLRGGSNRPVRFPDRLRDREWGTVVLPLGRLWPWGGAPEPELRVDGMTVGAVAGGDGAIALRFLPDGLPSGFHLVEVVDRSGRLLKARMVEKVR